MFDIIHFLSHFVSLLGSFETAFCDKKKLDHNVRISKSALDNEGGALRRREIKSYDESSGAPLTA